MQRSVKQFPVGDWLIGLRRSFAAVGDPAVRRRVQGVVLLLLLLWGVMNAVRLFWAAMPAPEWRPPETAPINPVTVGNDGRVALAVNLDAMLGLGLFGEPVNAVAEVEEPARSNPREGIEQGARETRLELTLQGIVASTADGLGSAIIDSRGKQASFSVGDALPVAGNVTLAKVLPRRVVLDNNGTYELLTLFEDSVLPGVLTSQSPETVPTPPDNTVEVSAAAAATANTDGPARDALASRYREQLYSNPESLAGLVKVAAVRGEAGLRGYRISPGRDAQRFRSLGFEAGDVVTAVNGLPLSDPTNTMRLYQLMRDATEASFEIDRNGTVVTLSVSLAKPIQE